jgi:hypothetical protein
MGDLNVLNMSPLLERMVDGTFHEVEETCGVVPFQIDGEHPKHSRFIMGSRNRYQQKRGNLRDGKNLPGRTLRELLEF